MNSADEAKVVKQYLSPEIKFYTISDLIKMLGWSEYTVQKLFNDPNFPSVNYGRIKVVEAHALIAFFSRKHRKETEAYWKKSTQEEGLWQEKKMRREPVPSGRNRMGR